MAIHGWRASGNMTGEVEVEVGVVEEVEVGVWRPPVGAGAGAGAGAATRLSEPVIPVRVLMNGSSP